MSTDESCHLRLDTDHDARRIGIGGIPRPDEVAPEHLDGRWPSRCTGAGDFGWINAGAA
ncbi:MAG TPA: hypothetical protein H9881_01590 [Candidatus Stackebrandtia excrementipullorum]|nr:hypothetical protein [Candidatus Stackebrandtia excrementipullorum]